ncbi:alpha/beta fold hydrolase [Nonomuraea sp. NPDC059194]|uniref:alpha/beta fold hydrolase n=1 Tax=Nonomuraea sp. NPDC059194 TaxID=3346764 RepID=UPI00369CFCE8
MAIVHSADGTAISYDRVGSGPAVILVDGATAYRAVNPSGAELAELLSSSFTVYTYDRRGRGESGEAAADISAADAVAAEIADIDALIAEAGGSAAVCGGSSGAVLALEAALAGSSITRLALYEPPFVVTDDRAPVPADYRQQLLTALADGRPGDAAALFLGSAVGIPAEYVEGMRQGPEWGFMEQVAHTLPYDAAAMGSTMLGEVKELERFTAIQTPSLVLYGGNSDAWMVAAATALAEVLPNAELACLEGQDHAVAATAIAPALSRFFA